MTAPLSPKGSEHNKRAEDIAENFKPKLLQLYRHTTDVNSTIMEIAKALEEFAREAVEKSLAQRDLEQFGESFVLNGRRIGPNEIYKSTADYVKEAREEGAASMRERAAKVADDCTMWEDPCDLARGIRALPLTPDSEVKPEVK